MPDSNLIIEYFSRLSHTKLNSGILIPYSIIMLFIYINRVIMYYRTKKRQHDLKNWGFVSGHLILEFLIGYIVGWSIIILTFSDDHSLFINYIIAPFAGFLAGIYLDHKIFLQLNTTFNKKTSSGGESSNKDVNNITVNINTDEHHEDHDSNIEELVPIKSLDKSVIESKDFESILVSTINSLIESENKQTEELRVQLEKIKKNNNTLDSLKDNEIINKRVELKKMIYDCLNNGFATPAENDKITQYYIAYTELGGNHEIQTLYEQHYLKLGVHEDRRKNNNQNNGYNIYINNQDYEGPDRRGNTERKIYTYGEFDNESLMINNTKTAIEAKDDDIVDI